MKLAYLTYPYSDDPDGRTEEVLELAEKIIEKNPDLVLLIPHITVDNPRIRNVIVSNYGPVGFAKWDLTLIRCCHAVIIGYPVGDLDPKGLRHSLDYMVSKGAVWEVAFGELEGKEIIDVRELL